jgi:phosphatidylinositol glycan class T
LAAAYHVTPHAQVKYQRGAKAFVPTGEFASSPHYLFRRYLAGQGQHYGTLTVEFHNKHASETVDIQYFDALPWFLKLFFHTLTLSRNGRTLSLDRDVSQFRFSPAHIRGAPAELEFCLSLPPLSTTTLTVEFEKVPWSYVCALP